VPVEELPPVSVLGLNVSEVNEAGFTVNVVVFVAPSMAVSVTKVCAATPLEMIVKLVLVEPAGTVTLAGTCATEVLLLCSVTVAPPDGAAPLSVTVPVELLPPTNVLGVLLNVESTGALTVSVAFLVTVPYVAEITTGTLELTGVVVIVNVAEVLPAGIVTLPLVGT
jgi:hypothetical protein